MRNNFYDAILKKEVKENLTKAFIIPIKEEKKAISLAEELRKNKIKTELEIKQRSMSASMDYASKSGIPFVIFIGKEEAKKKKIKIRDMKTGKEKLASVKDVIKILNRL